MSAAARTTSILLGALLLAACASSGGTTAGSEPAAVAPGMTIERFMRAANQNDLDTMATLFGTRDGPVRKIWPKKDADERLFLIASVLRHTDYTIGEQQIVPGRREEATRIMIRIVGTQRTVEVPFTLVRSGSQWLVEDVCFQRLTGVGQSCG